MAWTTVREFTMGAGGRVDRVEQSVAGEEWDNSNRITMKNDDLKKSNTVQRQQLKNNNNNSGEMSRENPKACIILQIVKP